MTGKLRQLLRRVHTNENGITGLETAIILIAFVVVATVFAFIVLTTGVFSAERGKETVYAGLQKARGSMELRGGVIIQSTGCPSACAVASVTFQVGNAAGGDPISLDPSATSNRTVMLFRDADTLDDDLTYTVSWPTGNGDAVLERGELAAITLTGASNPVIAAIAGGDRWTIEIQTPNGAVTDVTRSMPATLQAVMQLR
jgi:archaeal flagellin FlaB